MRSAWKSKPLLKQKLKIFMNRYLKLPDNQFNNRIWVHNGKEFASVLVRKSMLNRPLAEFIPSKIFGRSIHERKQKKQKNK